MHSTIENTSATVSTDRSSELSVMPVRASVIAGFAAIVAILVGIAVLFGWLFDLPRLKTVWPGLVSMKANTALGFILAGISLAAWTFLVRSRFRAAIVRTAAVSTALIGGVTLLEYVFDFNVGIDELIIVDHGPVSEPYYPGRPAPATAANFLLLGLALMLLSSQRSLARRVAECFALAVCLVATLTLIGYLYGVHSLYGVFYFSSVAVHTAATFVLLSVGVFCAPAEDKQSAPERIANVGSMMARRFFPVVLGLPIALGWLYLRGVSSQFFDYRFGLALFAISNIMILSCLVWWVSRSLNRLDEDRRVADESAKANLRESAERLRLAQHAGAIGTFELNIQTGVNTWTPELEAMYGLASGTFGRTQQAWEQLVHADDRPRALATVERAFATIEPQEGEWRVIWPDGSIHWLVGRFQVLKDCEGKPLRLIGVNIDITARKAIEESLRESEARALAVLEAASDAIITIDHRGIIHSANRATERLFGYSPAELIGQNISILMPQPYYDEHSTYLERYLSTGERRVIGIGREVEARGKDGGNIPVDLAVSEVSLVGRRLFTGILRDASERKLAEKKLDEHRTELAHVLRLNTMGEMATGLAHEINQPLAAIQNFAHGAIRRLADGAYDAPELIQVATSIANESARASTIIQRLKHYVKKGSGERKAVDINAVVRNAIHLVAVQAERRGVAVTVQCDPSVSMIQGDPVQLEQVVINLLLNGIEALESCACERRLHVQTENTGSGVAITVADSGPGLPADSLEQIFKAFFTTKAHGLGMGLAISRSIIEAHDGRLWAESDADGAIFRIALPADEESAHGG